MGIDVYGTLGPACSDAGILEQMFQNGMTGVRMNLSHVTLKDAMPQVEALQEAARRCGVVPKLLIDMQGPELRVGAMEDTELKTGETAVEQYPAEVIKYLTNTINAAERYRGN